MRVVQFLSGELSVSCIYSLKRHFKNFITNATHYCCCMEEWWLLRLPSITGGKFLESNSVCRLDQNRRQIKNPEGHENKCTVLFSVYNTDSHQSNVLVLQSVGLESLHNYPPWSETKTGGKQEYGTQNWHFMFPETQLFKQTQNRLHVLNARSQDASV